MALYKNAERYSFNQLLKTNSFNIQIPIIQRDYAQGRESQLEVRTNFLGAIYKYLEEGSPNRDLDFVYGYISHDKNFIPLDGQQRLTTLFLLHWYLANLNGDHEFIETILLNKGKSTFTYRTRFSSTDFCEGLLKNEINLFELIEPDKGKRNSLSKSIINKGWFQKHWKSDPTVSSMLVMLDDIHHLFKNRASFYQGLISDQPVITFLFLNLQDLKQGDDLYIKMNSRGKPLTNFENFKAMFEQELGEVFTDSPLKYSLSMGDKIVEYTPRQYFSYKIDCVWTDLFWNFRTLVGDPNTYDEELMNFVRASLTFSYMEQNPYNKEVTDLLLDKQPISFQKQKELNLFTADAVRVLIHTFDTLQNGSAKPSNKVEDKFYFDFKIVFENILKNTASIPERVVYYAYICYLNEFPDKILELQDWMRVIANLVENTRFDNPEHFHSAIRAIRKIIDKAPVILTSLDQGLKIDFFLPDQVYEERMKAKAILSDRGLSDSWEDVVLEAEKAVFHKGQIGYLFEFCGVASVSDLSGSLQSAKEDFKTYFSKSKGLFSILENNKNDSFLLERALLTFGNYLLENSNWRYNFSSSRKVANYDRDFSWKRILRVDFSSTEQNTKARFKRFVFRDLVDSGQFQYSNDGDVENSLMKIIKQSSVSDWRKDFIADRRIIATCGQGYIYDREYNHHSIQLLNASQMNHLRHDLNTLVLYHEISDKSFHHPFYKPMILPARGYEDNTLIILSGWCHDRVHYKVLIEYSERKYYLTFSKSKGVNKPEEYGEDINRLLSNLRYIWKEYGYDTESSSKSGIVKKYKELLDGLSQL